MKKEVKKQNTITKEGRKIANLWSSIDDALAAADMAEFFSGEIANDSTDYATTPEDCKRFFEKRIKINYLSLAIVDYLNKITDKLYYMRDLVDGDDNQADDNEGEGV